MTNHLFPNYSPKDVQFSHGKGAYLYDEHGREYLDFSSGIAVTALGHSHPALIDALTKQAEKYWHCSNLYSNSKQQKVAAKLAALTYDGAQSFFCNSGTEAVEGMLKTARRYHFEQGRRDASQIIGFHNSFHGRTMAPLAASGNKKYMDGFGQIPNDYRHCPFGNDNVLKSMINDKTAAIILEPVQGEGGIFVPDKQFLQTCRQVADEHNILLLMDEVQTGVGRTGKFWAHQWAGIEADIIASAKGLGGGFPVGAIIAKPHISQYMTVGTHGSTYGGNPLAMAVVERILDIVGDDSLLEHVCTIGAYLHQELHLLARKYDAINHVRGTNLLCGLSMVSQNKQQQFVAKAYDNGLLCVPASNNVVRLLPPLIIEEKHVDAAIAIMNTILQEL